MKKAIMLLVSSLLMWAGYVQTSYAQTETVSVQVGTGDFRMNMPFHFGWRHSMQQTLYFPHELLTNGGEITGLVYDLRLQHLAANSSPTQNIRIWIGETTVENLSSGWVDPTTLTLVFDGQIELPVPASAEIGQKYLIQIDFDTPFEYQGGTLVVYSFKHMAATGGVAPGNGIEFFGTQLLNSNRSRTHQVNGTVVPNPMSPPAGTLVASNVPNTRFLFNMAGLGSVSGVVSGSEGALGNVRVEVVGTSIAATTDSEGQYRLFLTPGDYNLRTIGFGYSDQIIPITITADGALIENIALIPDPASEFVGSATLGMGQIFNNIQQYNARVYTISNSSRATADLIVSEVSSSNEITLAGLPVTVPPGESRTITVQVNASALSTGAFSGKTFVLGTNDREREEVTVEVSGTVAVATIMDVPFEENFTVATLPAGGWQFVGGASAWIQSATPAPTTHVRTSLTAVSPTASIRTAFFDLENISHPLFSFSYRATTSATGVTPAAVNTVSFIVRVSNDFGQTWNTVGGLAQGEHIAVSTYADFSVDLQQFAGDTVLVQIVFARPTIATTTPWISVSQIGMTNASVPVFIGESSVAMGTVTNNIPLSDTTIYTIKNRSLVDLTVNYVSSTAPVTVLDLPITISPFETQEIRVVLNAHGLSAGTLDENFILATNDPENSQVTVDVTGTVAVATVLEPPFRQNFLTATPAIPAWWTSVGFTRATSPAPAHLRANLTAAVPRGSLTTTYIDMNDFAPMFAFRYRVTTNTTPGSLIEAPASSFRFDVQVSNDFGQTWEIVRTVEFGEHVASANYATLDVDLNEFEGDTVLVRLAFERNPEASVNIFISIEEVYVWEIPTGSVFDGPATLSMGTVFNNIPQQLNFASYYSFLNRGITDLEVDLASTSEEVTVLGLPLVVPPGETGTFTVRADASEFAAGAFSGNFVLETNDPNNDSVTVGITGTVATLFICDTLNEGFAAVAMPTGWLGNQGSGGNFTRNAAIGVGGTAGVARANLLAAGERILTTCYVNVGLNPMLAFYYRALSGPLNSTPASANEVSYIVRVTRDLGVTWEIVDSLILGDHVPTMDFTRREVNLSAFENQIIRIQFIFPSHGVNVNVDVDEIVGTWEFPVMHTVNITPPTNGTITVMSGNVEVANGAKVEEGTELTLTATAAEYFEFTQWWDGNTDLSRTITLISDITISAEFSLVPIMHTVTITAPSNGTITVMDGTVEVTSGSELEEGTELTLTATPAEYFEFTQWWDGNTDLSRTITLISDTTISAEFSLAPIMHTVTITAPSNGTITVMDGTVEVTSGSELEEGTELTLTATPAEYFEFTQWWDGNTDLSRTITLISDTTISAEFSLAPIMHTVTITAPSNGTITVMDGNEEVLSGNEVEEGTELTLIATPAEGHEFAQWWDGDTTSTRSITITSDTTISATFHISTAIQDISGETVLSVYPNPISDVMHIQAEESITLIEVFDLQGRVMMRVCGDTRSINLQSIPAGNYVVRIHTEDRIVPIRIVKIEM